MVTDQEPRYRLVDSNGNIVGTLFAESDGTLKLQEGTSGDDNDVALSPDGTLETKQMRTSIEDGDTDISGSRSFGTTETNNTGRDIFLSVSVSATGGSNFNVQLRTSAGFINAADTIDAVQFDSAPNGYIVTLSGRIRAGDEYVIEDFAGNGSIESWIERGL